MDTRTAAEWLNPVKVAGIGSYLVASISCGVTAIRAADLRLSRLAVGLGLIQVALLLDIALDWRWRLYDWLRGRAVAAHWYEVRHWPQVFALAVLAFVLCAAAVAARRRFRPFPGAVWAVEGTLLSAGCWMTEVISLHTTDSILYYRVGLMMVISFLWAAACLMTSVGILKAGIGDKAA